MIKKIYKNTIIDFCSNCGSIWLNQNELKNILFNNSKAIQINLLEQIKKEIKKEQNKITYLNFCPYCSNQKLTSKSILNINLDHCIKCNGLFFDYNELEKIIKNYNKLSFLSKILFKLTNYSF